MIGGGGALPDGSRGPHVIVDDLNLPLVDDDQRRHLDRVLRLRPGSPTTATDGRGQWRPCRWTGSDLDVDGEIVVVAPATARLCIAVALAKGSKPDLVVQKLTELGLDTIILFPARRSVPVWPAEKAARQLQRLRRISAEALMQSRGVWLPTVDLLAGFREAAELPGAVLADRDGVPLGPTDCTVLIGPEGGWSADERDAGLRAVRIASPTLRAETAAITAGALLTALRDGHIGLSAAHPAGESAPTGE